MLLSAQAALTKHHRLNGLSNRHLFLIVLQPRKTKIEVLVCSVLCEGPFPDLQAVVVFSLCPHTDPSVCVLISPYCKDTSHIGSRPTPATSFKLSWLFKDFPKYSHILSYWRLRHQHTNYGGGQETQFNPKQKYLLLTFMRTQNYRKQIIPVCPVPSWF